MIIVLDDRTDVADGYIALLRREGVAACALPTGDVPYWLSAVSDTDLAAIEAIIVGEVARRPGLCQLISARTRTVIIATRETLSLEETLELFAAGVDDVVRKPIHVREMLARIRAVARRSSGATKPLRFGQIQVFGDGRDSIVGGDVMPLPRRERRILEFLMLKSSCWVSKAQIFHAVYGLFNDDFDENVVESHISKLRKRLRQRLGYDPIDSKRYQGYRLVLPDCVSDDGVAKAPTSYVQVECGLVSVKH